MEHCGIYREIPIEDVEIGMILGDIIDNHGYLQFNGLVTDKNIEKIQQLRQSGITTVIISQDSNKEESVSDGGKPVFDTDREDAYYMELRKAEEVHIKTIEAARDVLGSVRLGKRVNTKSIERVAEEIVESILRNPDALVSLAQIKGYDEYTFVHSVNVGILITSLANSIGYRRDLLLDVGVGGLLHDIGKMRVPEHILNKNGTYTQEEFSIMKKHPVHGLNILKESKNISDISKIIIAQHHERFNGKGYPKGVYGKQIHEAALIAAVADVYDAMTTDRVYRAAWLPQRALAMIFKGADTEYSRRIVELFTRHLGIYPVGSFVKLVSGEMGVVVRVDKGQILAPDILVLFSKNGLRLTQPVEYNLVKKQKEAHGELYRIESSLNPKSFNIDISKYVHTSAFE